MNLAWLLESDWTFNVTIISRTFRLRIDQRQLSLGFRSPQHSCFYCCCVFFAKKSRKKWLEIVWDDWTIEMSCLVIRGRCNLMERHKFWEPTLLSLFLPLSSLSPPSLSLSSCLILQKKKKLEKTLRLSFHCRLQIWALGCAKYLHLSFFLSCFTFRSFILKQIRTIQSWSV